MAKLKRIVALAMAMIICTSFCCYNIGAAYEYAYFTGSLVREVFSDTSAYAELDIDDWSHNTDLYAMTFAWIEDYDYMDGFDDLTVYVDLYVQLEDEFTINNSSSYEDTWSGDTELEAWVYGDECTDSENDYSIIDFGSDHEVVITVKIIDEGSGNDYYEYINDGPIISIVPG